jgi:hypothetical protein
MRTRLPATLVPIAVVALCAACGDGSDLPTGSGSWHGSTVGTGGNPAMNGSMSVTSSSGSGSGGSTSTSGSSGSGGATGSSGSGSGGTMSSGSSSGGSGSSSGTSTAAPPNLGVTVGQATLQAQLLSNAKVQVSVAPNGYSGMVTLGTGTMPTGVSAKFDTATMTLDGSTPGTANLELDTLDSTPSGTVMIDVQAMADGVTAHASVSLEVQPIITIHIPAGVNGLGGTTSNPVTDAYGPYPFKIVAPSGLSAQNPVTVYFMNDDGQSHEIHADNPVQGFGHDPGPFGAHSMDPYVRQVNAPGSYDFYLHDQGAPITIGLVEVK